MNGTQRIDQQTSASSRAAAATRVAGAARPGRVAPVASEHYLRQGAGQAWRQRETRYAAMAGGAELLARMIDRMGGGEGCLARGGFVNLRA